MESYRSSAISLDIKSSCAAIWDLYIPAVEDLRVGHDSNGQKAKECDGGRELHVVDGFGTCDFAFFECV